MYGDRQGGIGGGGNFIGELVDIDGVEGAVTIGVGMHQVSATAGSARLSPSAKEAMVLHGVSPVWPPLNL